MGLVAILDVPTKDAPLEEWKFQIFSGWQGDPRKADLDSSKKAMRHFNAAFEQIAERGEGGHAEELHMNLFYCLEYPYPLCLAGIEGLWVLYVTLNDHVLISAISHPILSLWRDRWLKAVWMIERFLPDSSQMK